MSERKGPVLDATRVKTVITGIMVGLLTGVVVSAFRFGIEQSLRLVKASYGLMHQQPWLLVPWIVGMILLGGAIAWLVKTSPQISGSGIPQVEGQLTGEYHAPWWPTLWKKFVGGLLAIGSGMMLGREGPSIQLGATVGQGYATLRGNSAADQRVALASGAAAGLAAAFNAPIASTLFVLEEIYHNFSPLVWLTSLTSAVVANFVSLLVFGQVPVLHMAYAQALPLHDYWVLVGLGVVLGLLGRVYQAVLLRLPKWYAMLRAPRSFDGVIALLLTVPIGWWWASVLGGGNAVILNLAQSRQSVALLLALFTVRFIFSMVAYGSGVPGGIFLPILTLGAIIGAVYGQVLINWGILPQGYLVNLIIVAMAGYFAGIGKAPFTAILLITEMVGSLKHLMPLAVVCLVAYITVDVCGGAPIYESLLHNLLAPSVERPTGAPDRLEVPVFAGTALVDHEVREIAWPANALLIGIRRGEGTLIPHGDTIVRAGDTLVITTQHENRAFIHDAILKLAEQTSPRAED
ncbi:ClC family H(+)/Cl(-) exchange transporter [Furfurilactobacillus sp. WILCCON 0119]|uniref:ClC family H(+)/Cl(-) exchange transporter n=1 Tax=Furfurilactobacillus entadae TaxID=2922307 RepID=UPI0035EB7D92